VRSNHISEVREEWQSDEIKEKAEILMIRLWIEKEAECIYKLQSLKRLEERIRKKSRRGDRCFHAHFRNKKRGQSHSY